MLRLILAVVTVLIVAASLTSRLSEVRAASNKASASNQASTGGTGVVQPSIRSATQKSGTSPRIRQGWPSKVHW
jgi:uncharacterized membrane protein